MRIGILTLPFNNNYGGYLQAYALMTVLKQMGHDVEIIYRRPNRRSLKARLLYPIKKVVRMVLRMPRRPWIMNQEYDLRQAGKLMMPFVDKYIAPKTKPFYTTAAMEKACKGRYDAIIVGSDQVWRAIYVPNIYDFFLDFVKDDKVKKIAYAASFGTATPEYTEEEKMKCGTLIKDFVAVSVRERSGLDVIKSFGWQLNCEPQEVLDPTFLLPKDEYIKHLQPTAQHQIFCYILDKNERTKEIIEHAENLLHLPTYEILKDERQKTFCKPSIETWLGSIYNSDFILTDSFHGMVFCIIFNKPFAIHVNQDRGADRFHSLLSKLGLESRIIKNTNDIDRIVAEPINWSEVNKKLAVLRDVSVKFISEALKQ